MKHAQIALGLAVSAALAGCNFTPKYTRPNAPVPAQWPAYSTTRPVTPASDVPALPWRAFFTDPKLQRLIETALKNNRDLRLAALNVQRAQGIYGIQRTALLPTLDASAAFTRRRTSAEVSSIRKATTENQYNVAAVLSWELDFFGRLSNLAQAALEEYLATEQGRRSAQILIISSVANAYLTLAADRENLKLAQGTLKAQQESYALVKKRLEGGLGDNIDLFRAQTQVDTARGDVARYTQLVGLDENALNLLLGAQVSADLIPADLNNAGLLREISPGISSDLLLLRPDVLAAEARLRAAYANIGAARAALFPRISLTGIGGFASTQLSSLFNSSSHTWTFAPQATTPIFDGRAWSALAVTKTDREIAVTGYERAIQVAFREVADALAVRATVGDQLAAQESLVRAASETYRLSVVRYDKGLRDYLDVLDAQRSLYAAQEGLISLRLATLTNQVRLYSTLGGGWQE